MAKQSGKSGLFNKYGQEFVKAHEEHKDDTTKFDTYAEIPPGVEGIAKLYLCRFEQVQPDEKKQDKKYVGEYYFTARGTCVYPRYWKDKETGAVIEIEGRQTSIGPEMCCHTPKQSGKGRQTQSEHMGWIYNELRKLGLDTAALDPRYVEEAALALETMSNGDENNEPQPIYFKFRTFRSEPNDDFPNPKTQHIWGGVTEFDPEKMGGEPPTNDSSPRVPLPPAAPTNGTGAKVTKPTAPKPSAAKMAPTTAVTAPKTAVAPKAPVRTAPKPVAKQAPAPEPEEPETTFDEFSDDLDSLKERADRMDKSAMQRLEQLAMEAGMTDEDFEKANWEEVVEFINNAGTGLEEDPEAEPEETTVQDANTDSDWKPSVEDVYAYRIPDPKTGQPMKDKKTGKEKPPVDCEVLKVDTKKRTVTLKNMTDEKEYKDVSWDALETSVPA